MSATTPGEAKSRIALVTAGAGGMYCGSCLQDNAVASALLRQGLDVLLIPTYTPLRTDEADVSDPHVFYGGINVFLQQKVPFFRWLPGWADRVLDHPALIRAVTSFGMQTDAAKLGPLTVSMLRGEAGWQRKEVLRLCRWLGEFVQPDLIQFSNILIAGGAAYLARELRVPLLVTLQGDDYFLDGLPVAYRRQALQEIQRLSSSLAGFVTHSHFYADHMSAYLSLPRDRFHVVPLGVAAGDFDPGPRSAAAGVTAAKTPTIGYLARLAPEKGLHLLCEAFLRLRQLPETANVQLRVAGWLGKQHRRYVLHLLDRLKQAGAEAALQYDGEVDRAAKVALLREIDVLSVPSPYRDPKGLYVLEALSAGVPVVQPSHGAFPELLANTSGGRLFTPDSVDSLTAVLAELLTNEALRRELGQRGQAAVRQRYSIDAAARALRKVYAEVSASAAAGQT